MSPEIDEGQEAAMNIQTQIVHKHQKLKQVWSSIQRALINRSNGKDR